MVYITSQQAISITIIAWAVALGAAERPCYFPSGATHSLGLPCNPDTEGASSCCESTHVCLSNSLCLDTLFNHVVRGSCTDEHFQDGACPQYCKSGSESARLADLRQCNGQNDYWICSNDVTYCDEDMFQILPGQVDDRRNSSVNNVIHPVSDTAIQTSSSSASPTSTTSTASRSTTTPATGVQDGDSNSELLKVALGVGLGVGFPLLAVLIMTLWFLRKTRQQLVEAKSGSLLASRQGSIYQQECTNQGHQTYPLKDDIASIGAAPALKQQIFQPQVSTLPGELEGDSHLVEFPTARSRQSPKARRTEISLTDE